MSKQKSAGKKQSNANRWTSIRVSTKTKAMLHDLREGWIANDNCTIAELGTAICRSGQPATNGDIGLDQVVRRLIALVRLHRTRAASAQRRHKAHSDQDDNASTGNIDEKSG